jgi:hypothetical protein
MTASTDRQRTRDLLGYMQVCSSRPAAAGRAQSTTNRECYKRPSLKSAHKNSPPGWQEKVRAEVARCKSHSQTGNTSVGLALAAAASGGGAQACALAVLAWRGRDQLLLAAAGTKRLLFFLRHAAGPARASSQPGHQMATGPIYRSVVSF